MPIEYRIDPERAVIYARMSGDVSVEDIRDFRVRIRQDPAFTPALHQLLDCRGISREFAPADVRRLADFLRLDDEAGPGTRRAVLLDDPGLLGMMDVFSAYARGGAAEYRVVRSVAEGEDWLGVPRSGA